MTKSRIVQAAVFCLVLVFSRRANSATPAELSQILGPTVHRYLLSSGSYRKGDLITKSQVEELQEYLRKTQGHSAATHPRWRQHILPDNAPLVKISLSGGREVVSQAASKLGGYAELDQLSRTGIGRELLRLAIERKSAEGVIAHIEKERAARGATAAKKNAGRKLSVRIYTAEEFLSEVTAVLRAEAALAAQGEFELSGASDR